MVGCVMSAAAGGSRLGDLLAAAAAVGPVAALKDSSALYRLCSSSGKWEAIRDELEREGYLLLRNFLPHDHVRAAASAETPCKAAWRISGALDQQLKRLHDNEALALLFRGLSTYTREFCSLPEGAWRTYAVGEATAAHSDYLYFRNHHPAVFGDPFRPAGTSSLDEMCPRITVSKRHFIVGRGQRYVRSHLFRLLFAGL